jgi:hypothetical protein
MESMRDGVSVDIAYGLCRLAERHPEVRSIPEIARALSAQVFCTIFEIYISRWDNSGWSVMGIERQVLTWTNGCPLTIALGKD